MLNTFKEKVKNDREFLDLYEKAGLPSKIQQRHSKGKSKKSHNKICTHENLGMTRQYSKYLRHTGLVYSMKPKGEETV